MEENLKVFIVHHRSSGKVCPWPIHCDCCGICYWTSKENEEAALAAGMKVLCLGCIMVARLLGEEVVLAGGVKDGKVWDKERNDDTGTN